MLKKILAAGAVTAVATGTFLAGAPAYAVDDVTTSGAGGVLSGNQVVTDVNIPVNICGNAVAIVGIAGATCYKSDAKAY